MNVDGFANGSEFTVPGKQDEKAVLECLDSRFFRRGGIGFSLVINAAEAYLSGRGIGVEGLLI